jgi:hypothetical protein
MSYYWLNYEWMVLSICTAIAVYIVWGYLYSDFSLLKKIVHNEKRLNHLLKGNLKTKEMKKL